MSQFARFGNRKEQLLAQEFTQRFGHPPTDLNDPDYVEFKRTKSSALPVNSGKPNNKKPVPVFA